MNSSGLGNKASGVLGALLAAATVLAVLAGPCAAAADKGTDEYAVKAALVYNFMRFTEWPADPARPAARPFGLVVFGDEKLAASFAGLDGRDFGGRRISVSFTRHAANVAGCDLLFIAGNERDNWPQIMTAIGDAPVLTIAELPGFLEAGGDINLHLVDNRIRFQVNLDQARRKHLLISSRLLKLASSVINTRADRK